MIGMTIAVLTTLAQSATSTSRSTWILILAASASAAASAPSSPRRIPMTSMPELVAAFHSLVGLAAVFVAAGALYAPEAFGIGDARPASRPRA